jgi:Glycosyltransferase family 92
MCVRVFLQVIMPVNSMTWHQLMRDEVMPKALALRNETRASYNVRNVYFLDDLSHAHGWFGNIPRYMHMLQHVYRSKNFTKPGQYVKCFHNPERVLTLHNHFPLACLGSGCTSYPINTTDAQLQHYRADCVKTLKKSCVEFRQNSTLDTTIWKYREKLVTSTTDTLRRLGFFKTPCNS